MFDQLTNIWHFSLKRKRTGNISGGPVYLPVLATDAEKLHDGKSVAP
jgi:hypothetical protein